MVFSPLYFKFGSWPTSIRVRGIVLPRALAKEFGFYLQLLVGLNFLRSGEGAHHAYVAFFSRRCYVYVSNSTSLDQGKDDSLLLQIMVNRETIFLLAVVELDSKGVLVATVELAST